MKNITNPVLRKLRRVLEEKYFYKHPDFDNRTVFLSLGPNGEINALCFEVFKGTPFILFVASDSEPSKAFLQCAFDHALQTETIGTIAFYVNDVDEFHTYKRRFRDDEFEAVQGVEYYYRGSGGGQLRLLEERTEYKVNESSKVSNLIPITNKLENIFFEIHSVMRDIDGLHADAALEELCKLLYLKSHLEEQSENLPIKGVTTTAFGTTEEYASCLRALYRAAIEYDLRVYRLKIPEYERSRGVFNLPIYLSSASLVKAFQLIENFSLSQTEADLKGRAFQKVLAKSVRSGMGQYFTPVPVCQLMVDIINPSSSDLILDPFCGSGHFLTESLAHVRRETSDHSKEFHEFAFGKLHGIEKSDRMTRIAMTDMRLNGDGHSNIRCTDALLDFRNYPDIKPESFDVVLTNPPFGSLLGVEAFSMLGHFVLSQNRKKVPLEIVGLERAIQFLRPGGRIGIVLPESVFSANSCNHVREWLQKNVAIRIVIDLPNETFTPFGANVRSGLLFARKLMPGEKTESSKKVCMIRLDSLGYDASGRDVGGSEVRMAAKTAKDFLRKEGW